MLSLKNVVVHYGGVQALKGISLEVVQGAITCLIGANGAGKSTTLRAISGIVPLTTGEIWFQGRRIDGMDPEEIVEIGIGHVPEGKRLFLEMNVRDNLMTGAHLRHDKERIDQDLKRIYSYFPVLGVAISRPASTLSGGEQQMLAIGRGLMCAPKLLLLDEPSLGLSPILTREVGAIIKKIADEGVSILLIEQNANLALQLAQKCYVLETGKIALEGTSADLQNNEHVKAAYLGLCPTPQEYAAMASIGRTENKDSPEKETVKIQADRWQDAKTQVPESENRSPASHTPAKRITDVVPEGDASPEKFQFDLRIPATSNHNSAVSGLKVRDRWSFEGDRSTTTKKDTFARMRGDSSKKQPPRIVKKVFTPKQS
jgi:branched-chain amino acid transport system ATP-binding protein